MQRIRCRTWQNGVGFRMCQNVILVSETTFANHVFSQNKKCIGNTLSAIGRNPAPDGADTVAATVFHIAATGSEIIQY